MEDILEGILIGLIALIAIVAISAVAFLIEAAILWLICWAFGWVFSWKIAFGIWLVMILIRSCFKSTTTVKKD